MKIRIYIPAHYDRMDMVKALTSSGYHTWIEDNGFIGKDKKYFVCFECDDNEVERFDHEGNAVEKVGHWIFVDKAHEHASCSECGYGNVDFLDGRSHNYCENCGAKMQGVTKEKSCSNCKHLDEWDPFANYTRQNVMIRSTKPK